MKDVAVIEILERLLPEELRRAQRCLSAAKRGRPHEAVHEARKSIKKLRAALRLASKAAAKGPVEACGAALRSAAHALGPLRDHLVLAETARTLAGRHETTPPEPAAPDAVPLRRKARADLRRASGSLRRLFAARLDPEKLSSGLRKIYRRAIQTGRRAAAKSSDENLHAWRRRAKDLYYVAELIAAPASLVKELKRLTQLLGDDHDLAVFIQHHSAASRSQPPLRLLKRAHQQRRPLQKKAFRLEAELFATKPRRFARRLLD